MDTSTDMAVFHDLAGELSPSSREGAGRLAGLNIATLRKVLMPGKHESVPTQLTFNLFDDLTLSLQTRLIEPFGANGVTWRGELAGVPNVRGYLSVIGLKEADHKPIAVSGHISLEGQRYAINPAGDGKVRIARIGITPHFCCDSLLPPDENADVYYDNAELVGVGESVAVIHVLALYPTGAKTKIGDGAAGIEAMMSTAQTLTNEAFLHSGISARVEITTQELPALRNTDPEALLADVVKTPGSEVWNVVTQARDKAQAAIVALLTSEAKILDGGGWVAGIAASIPEPPRYGASDLSYATFAMVLGVNQYTFTHELGHLLGGKHDRLTQPVRAGLDPKYDYARGYVPADKSFVTIMGYEQSGMSYVPAYSAADRTWNGKALGIPFGQADAADAAHLFRLSTQVVARYRGDGAPRWEPVNLDLSVHPTLGGAVTPSGLGPYPKGSVVGVTATARAGYRFTRWLLDNEDAGSHSALTVTMDKAHTLAAQFVEGDAWCALTAMPLPDANLQIRLAPPGPAYLPGTEVYVELAGVSATYKFVEWLVDGQPAGDQPKLRLRMEQDHQIEARLADARQLSNNTNVGGKVRVVEAGAAQTLTAQVVGPHGDAPGQWVVFTLQQTSTGSLLESPTRVQSNERGDASVTLRAGHTAGDIKVTVALEGSTTASPITFAVTVPKRFVAPVSTNGQHFFDGDPPAPFVVQVRELGKPVGAGVKVKFELSGAMDGLSLLPGEAETDANGSASATLTRSAHSTGRFRIGATTAEASSPATFDARCVAVREFSRIGESWQNVLVGEQLKPFSVVINDDGNSARNLPIHVSLVPGTTGITLETETVITDADGQAEIVIKSPTGTGLATITAQVPHTTAPVIFGVHVLSGTGAMQVVSGNRQAVPVTTVTPAPLVVQVLDSGQPVGAGVKVNYTMQAGTTGFSLVGTETQTDEYGRASMAFAGTANAKGQAEISVSTESALSPSVFHVRAFVTRWLQMSRDDQTITVGLAPSAFIARVYEDDQRASDVTVHFTMENGTTGLKLKTDSAVSNENGQASVEATEATGVGEAKVTASADYVEFDSGLAVAQVHVDPKT